MPERDTSNNHIHNVFTWLNVKATINHLCEMTVVLFKGGYYSKGGVYYNAIIIATAIQKPGEVYICSANNSILIIVA